MRRALCVLALAGAFLFGCSDGGEDTDPTDSGVITQADATANRDATAQLDDAETFPDATANADATTFPDATTGEADATTFPDATTGQPDAASTLAGFGEACATAADCDPAVPVCRNFNQVGMVCTKECQDNSECPSGSMGQRCNNMGVCRP